MDFKKNPNYKNINSSVCRVRASIRKSTNVRVLTTHHSLNKPLTNTKQLADF